jgi:hypothetical protein
MNRSECLDKAKEIVNGARQDVQNYITFVKEAKDILGEDGVYGTDDDGPGAQAADARLKVLDKVYGEYQKGANGAFAKIYNDAEAMAEFWKIFNTDVGTYEWAK